VDSRKVSSYSKKIASHGLKLAKDNSFWIAKGEGEKISGHISILDDIIEKLSEPTRTCTCLLVYNDIAANYIIDGLKEKASPFLKILRLPALIIPCWRKLKKSPALHSR
jgi:LacI family transcriptional regulator